MSWAKTHIEKLQRGEQVKCRPSGNSMTGIIESKQLCTIIPITLDEIKVGDVVLCRVSGNDYLHLVKAKDKDRALIGNNKGGTNGWTKAIYGKCIKVEP
jgi:hypothetical protein